MLDRMPVDTAKRRFTADEYQRMGDARIFPHRVELIDGEILTMSPIGSAHAAAVNRANRLLVLATDGRALAAVQNLQLPTLILSPTAASPRSPC